MTPEEQRLIMDLAVGLGDGPKRPVSDVLDHFGEPDGAVLALRLLNDAIARQDADDLEMAFLLRYVTGAPIEDVKDLYVELFPAEWHREHEEIVTALGRLRSPELVPTMVLAIRWVPEGLSWDENRALAVKAIWALGAIPGPEAQQALEDLRDAENEIIRENALHQLARRAAR
ncbi:HEAT repeat domain-containing protein [Streptomyces sp. NPDC048659]|uniref:HEAT repeat domain-containing protein n=1 Tax=Streptomyces sp. NPDC048659 TaxID=3155489 RepID=UPI00344394C1